MPRWRCAMVILADTRRARSTPHGPDPQQEATDREVGDKQGRCNECRGVAHLRSLAYWRAVAQVTTRHWERSERRQGFPKHRA